VQTPDDEQFESYLKRFHPVAPEPLRAVRLAASRRLFTPGAWVAAIAAVLIVGVIVLQTRALHTRNSRVAAPTVRYVASLGRRAPSEPLTIGSANAWLATAPSLEAAIDDLAFGVKSNPIPRDKQSAIAVLREEKTKL
jgi:hypothetical protein